MRKAIILCAGIALVAGLGCLTVRKARANTDTDQPTPVTAKPVDDQPVAVVSKPADDQPIAVAEKPAEDQPSPVEAKPADDQPAEVKEPTEVVAAEETTIEAKPTPAAEPAEIKKPATVVVEEKIVAEVKATPVAQPVEVKKTATVVVEEKIVAEVKAAPVAQPVEVKKTATVVSDEETVVEVKAAPVAQPVEVKKSETVVADEKTVAEVKATPVAQPAEVKKSATVVGEEKTVVEVKATPTAEPLTEPINIDTTTTAQIASKQSWNKPIPITFSIDYTLATDYIFRGINFSEYRRSWGQTRNEGREKLNHQLTIGAELDLKQFGRVGYNVWFEWFGGQGYLTPEDKSKNLQEVDHTVYYGYNIEAIGLDLEAGFIWYMFPRVASGDGASTQEIYLLQTIDDSGLWRLLGFKSVTKPILNPYLFMAWDLDLAQGGHYSEFGMSHDFQLGELGMKNTPLLKDITLTPTWSMGWDKNWLNKMSLDWMQSHPAGGLGNEGRGVASNSSHLDFIKWGLELNFDLKSALNIPDKYCGEMYIKGFLNFSDAIAKKFLNDEFYGGVSVGFSW